jgi:hypothetical protein
MHVFNRPFILHLKNKKLKNHHVRQKNLVSSITSHVLPCPPLLILRPRRESSRKHAKQNEARDASMRDAKKRKFAAIGLKDKRRKVGGGGGGGGSGGGARDADD